MDVCLRLTMIYFKTKGEKYEKNPKLCIRDKNGYIVGWKVGYSDDELKQLLERHKDEGWHISYAEYTEGELR